MDIATTTTLLLEGLLDEANEPAWRQFDDRYRPIVHAFARRAGLNEHDAADIAQETLLRFLKAYRAGRYDRTRGRLRSWLIGIVTCRLADLRMVQVGRCRARGDSAIVALPSPPQLTQIWDEVHRREILRQALHELRRTTRTTDTTFAAFEMFVLHEQPAASVALSLGLTRHDIYMAKRRVTERLREIVSRIEGTYGDGS